MPAKVLVFYKEEKSSAKFLTGDICALCCCLARGYKRYRRMGGLHEYRQLCSVSTCHPDVSWGSSGITLSYCGLSEGLCVSVNNTEILIFLISKQIILCYSLVPAAPSFPNCFSLHLNGRGAGKNPYACAEWSELAVSASLFFFHIAVLQNKITLSRVSS